MSDEAKPTPTTITRTFTVDELTDLLDDATEVDRAHWRHGSRVQYVFDANPDSEASGQEMYRTPFIDMHHDEGMQLRGPVKCTRVELVEVAVKQWRPVTA